MDQVFITGNDKPPSSGKNILLIIIVTILILVGFLSLSILLLPDSVIQGVKSSLVSGKITLNNKVKKTVPKIPEPRDTPSDKNIAIPKSVEETSNAKSKFRSFEIVAEKDSFSSREIIVGHGDIVSINFKSKDKSYDISIPVLHLKQTIPQGESRLLEFQAVREGTFDFLCTLCPKDSPTAGRLLVL